MNHTGNFVDNCDTALLHQLQQGMSGYVLPSSLACDQDGAWLRAETKVERTRPNGACLKVTVMGNFAIRVEASNGWRPTIGPRIRRRSTDFEVATMLVADKLFTQWSGRA